MSTHGGAARPAGDLQLRVIRAADERAIRDRFDQITAMSQYPAKELRLSEVAHFGLPRKGLDDRVNAWRTSNFRNLARGARRAVAARALGLANFYGSLYLTKIAADGEVTELGLASMRMVTTTGVGYIVDAFQTATSVELENMKYHGIGTGSGAEATGDTALVTELTTQYSTDNTRATGSTTENAANIYRTVGTNTVDASVAIIEHGILSQAATGGGVLLDRSVFSAVNLVSADSLQSTYDFTITAGS
jgi:hypothetical protein